MNIPYLSGDSFFAGFIELYVAEIERNVHGYFDKVEYIKEEAEVELQRREKIAGKKLLLQNYERTLNEELNLEGHFIVK